MLIPAPPKRRRPRKPKITVAEQQTPAAPLVLVSAQYEVGGLVLELTFDRAVDVSAIVPGAFVVWDGEIQFKYVGVSVLDQETPQTFRLNVTGTEDYFGEGIHMDVAEPNGIVAVDDGGTWAGATDLPLPWP